MLERVKEREDVRDRCVGQRERRGGTNQRYWRVGNKRRYEPDMFERWREEEEVADMLERWKEEGGGSSRQTCWRDRSLRRGEGTNQTCTKYTSVRLAGVA